MGYTMTDLRCSCDEIPVEFSSIYCRRVLTSTPISTIWSVWWCHVLVLKYTNFQSPPPTQQSFHSPLRVSKNFRTPLNIFIPVVILNELPLNWGGGGRIGDHGSGIKGWSRKPVFTARGDSHMKQTGKLVGNFEFNPKGDHLGVAQGFCDP